MRSNFITSFIEYNKSTEIPEVFAFWAGVGAISCALGRRVFIDMGHYQIYPNFYIVLVGSSGMKKSSAVNQAEKFLHRVDPIPNIISNKITPEALIKSLRGDSVAVGGVINFDPDCVGFTFVDELATFLNKTSYEAGLGSLLTPLYDCKEHFSYTTLARGKEHLKNTCFGILGGATIDWLQNAVPAAAVGGGVTSRFIFVYAKERPEPRALTNFTERHMQLDEELTKSIREIATISGRVTLSKECEGAYVEEYNTFYRTSSMYADKNLSGYANRRMQHLLKLAMMLSISETSTKVIEVRHFKAAKALLEIAEQHMPMVLALITSSTAGAALAQIYEVIRSNPAGVPRTTLLRLFLHQMSNRELSDILETLVASKQITMVIAQAEVIYRATKIK